MNLKSLALISTLLLSLSSITTAAPMPKVCDEFVNAANTSIDLLTKIKQTKPETAADADKTIAQIKDNLASLTDAIAQAPDNQLEPITKACTSGVADMKEMNKTLRGAL